MAVYHKYRGFTLVELMIVVAIFGILAMAAVPFFQDIISNNDLNTARTTLIHSLNKAKRIASAENTFVEIQLDNNSIHLSALASGKNESINIPGNVIFATKQNMVFNPNGVIVSDEGNTIESITEILITHKSQNSKQETISISTTGLVAAM